MASRRLLVSERIDRHENEGSSGSDTDDLCPAQRRAREKASKRLVLDLEGADSDFVEDEAVKVEWSDEDDPGAAYKAFKEKSTRKRKRPGATTASKAKTTTKTRSTTGVGKRAAVKRPRKQAENRVYGDESDSAEDAIEKSLPSYLQQRKRSFEANRSELDASGLKLPPSFDDVDFSDDDRLQSLTEKPRLNYIKPPAKYEDINLNYSAGIIPASIAQWLKPYQVEGAAFLHELFVYQKGGILGDDMGLGKTIQVIAALTAAFGKTGGERDAKRMRKMRRTANTRWYPRVLIVCPGSLIANWKSELDVWGWWNVYTFHGSSENKENALKAAVSGRLEIMITTYKTYTLNKSAINGVSWDCCVADECHMIKERKSEVTQAMNDVNALCRIGLTGTAIQNKYEELWTLLNWTNPGRFGPLSNWKSAVSEPLKNGQSHDATAAQLSKARKTAKKLVQNLLPEFFLRRMKSLIAHHLPKKTDRVVFCPMTKEQAKAYDTFVNSDVVTYIRTSTETCDCGSGKKKGWCCQVYLPETEDKWQNFVFPCMNILRNLASHIGLLVPSSNDNIAKLNKELHYLRIVFPDRWEELYEKREDLVTLSNPAFCGKWKVLRKLLEYWHNEGDKVLVFSFSIKLLKLLRNLFQSTSYNVSYLDGSMNYDDRARVVDDFNADPTQFVFLISTRAGGMGLNITSANKVVVVDPNWNPSFDLQAQDRAYRIGQTRDVEVFRLICTGTIEEIVYARQIYKQQQANIGYTASNERRYFKGVQENTEKKGEIFGLQNLFAYQSENIVLRDIVNKTNVAESRAGVQAIGLDLGSQEDDPGGNDDFLNVKVEDKEDEAMSQLAALIQDGNTDVNADELQKQRKKKVHEANAIQGILAGAGVEYTHENSEVVGSSKIEAGLSKRAEEAGHNVDKAVFAASQDFANDDLDLDDEGENIYGGISSDDGFNDDLDDGFPRSKKEPKLRKDVAFRYKPPEDVCQRQLCTMAKTFGYDDPVDFALTCETWTQAERRICLDRFYEKMRRGEVAV